ncbi:MAG: hypothetical protein AVDCRST_MAG64-893 [uncultured Phycisphaerae bacterium]|uniref:Uncharacterized protein n=1 Tax=uncultured Phycisphaerae bacterium TaxID=904963 RepID=A0A6J4NHP8_9BACT|nr:MAG: hypothetical protein AVDCRST_MAG64-893 [uncultured Phycisphaerae bacterium]
MTVTRQVMGQCRRRESRRAFGGARTGLPRPATARAPRRRAAATGPTRARTGDAERGASTRR